MKRAFLILLLLGSSCGRADDFYHVVIGKQEKKAENRWSLAQWLETRDRMRLMDLWLALHSPSPYEFYLGGEYQFGRADSSPSFNANAGKLYFGAYASIFGLEAQAQFRQSEWAALFNVRVFGLHVQATNITLHGGLRSKNDPTTYLNPLAGASLTLYLFKYFGVSAMYRHYFGPLHNDPGISESGHRFEAEAFLDFSFLRIYGQFFSELLDRSAGPGLSTRDREGFALGVRAFF
jgi:hypothetical protein